jgi:hypothetical protein
MNTSKESTRQISKFLKSQDSHVFDFLQKELDFIITDKKTFKKMPTHSKHMKNKRSFKLVEKSIQNRHESLSIDIFAAKWNIPLIDYKKLLPMCKSMNQLKEKETVYQPKPHKHMYRLKYPPMANPPFLDFSIPIPHSPFETWFRKNSKRLAKKKGKKWCELCNTYFEVVENHLQSIEHKQVATSDLAY